jgi:transaldolase
MSTVNIKKFSATQVCIQLMNEFKDQPMAAVVKVFTTSVTNRKGEKFSVAEATTAYRYLVKNGKAPGTIEQLTIVRAPKSPKAPSVKSRKAAVSVNANAIHLELLKAAAKRAGIHRDSLTVKDEEFAESKQEAEAEQEPMRDDMLGMAAPEKLQMSDLKDLI